MPARDVTFPDDDADDVRTARLQDKILLRIEEMLDELAPPHARLSERGVDIARVVRAQCAPLFCRQVLCRRSQRCRRDRCRAFRAARRGRSQAAPSAR